MKLDEAFRILRGSWFNSHLRSNSHERVWENEEEGDAREKRNEELKKRFDEETEAIINGEPYSVDPYCEHDMYKIRNSE